MGSLGEIMQLCRLCLVKDKVNIPIFEGAGDIRKISHKISACLPVKVAKDDKLPKKICDGCSLKLDVIYQFWNTSTASEKQLLEWVNNPSSLKGESQDSRTNVAEHIVLKQEIDNGDSEALDAGEFIDVNDSFENIGYTHDDDDDMSNENIAIKTENDSQSYIEPPRKKQKVVSLSSAESEEDADDPSDAYNRDDSDEEDNDISDAQPTFVNVSDADQQPGPSGVGKSSGDAPDEQLIKIDTTMGPRYVQKKFLEFQTSKEKSVSIVMKDGKTVPLLVKPVAITFRKELKTTVDNEIKKRKYCKGPKNLTMCEKCGKRFPNEERLVTHMETHHENSFRCTTCNKLFPTEVARRKHRYIVHSIKYTCDFCQVTLKSKKAYLVHTRRHAGEYSHKCEECGKEFYNSFSYNHHMDAEHAGIRYPCTICTSVLKSKRYFKAHMANHKEMAAIQFQCKVCKKYYSTKSGLLAHSKAHLDSRYVCDVCGKKSIQKGAHDAHMRSHTGERSFMCDLCGKGFIRKDVLDKHMAKVHESYKQACEKCGEFFLTNYELLIHMHTHDDIEKPFACEFCSERFLDKNILRNHVNRVHVENKPDKLAKNKIRTKVANNTTRKKKTEKKVGGFYCSICKAGYNTVASYKEHLHIHRTPYACNLCDVKFGDYLKLKAHLLRHDEDLKDENELEEEDDDYDNADDDDEEEEGEEIDNDGFFQREIKGETTDEEVSQGGLLEVEECQDETLVISEHDIAEINLKEETVITNEDE